MRKHFLYFILTIGIMTGLFLTSQLMTSYSNAQTKSFIQAQETSFPGVIAELTQCKRKKGVLTAKVRIKNTSSCLWLLFHHDIASYVALGMRLFDSKNKDHPRKMYHFRLKKNLFPGDEDIMTLQFPPLLRSVPQW